MNEKPPIILSVVQAGTPDHRRFKIHDASLRFWTGSEWVADERKGLMYANSNDACLEIHRLLMLEYMDRPVRRYRAPVYVDLFIEEEIPRDQLIRWLVKVSKLVLDSNTHGIGPGKALGLARVEWGELEQIKE